VAPAQKIEHTSDPVVTDRRTSHGEGIVSGSTRGYTSPVLGEDRDRTPSRAASIRTGFASSGGWVSFH
jgi:hypothetical protein